LKTLESLTQVLLDKIKDLSNQITQKETDLASKSLLDIIMDFLKKLCSSYNNDEVSVLFGMSISDMQKKLSDIFQSEQELKKMIDNLKKFQNKLITVKTNVDQLAQYLTSVEHHSLTLFNVWQALHTNFTELKKVNDPQLSLDDQKNINTSWNFLERELKEYTDTLSESSSRSLRTLSWMSSPLIKQPIIAVTNAEKNYQSLVDRVKKKTF